MWEWLCCFECWFEEFFVCVEEEGVDWVIIEVNFDFESVIWMLV